MMSWWKRWIRAAVPVDGDPGAWRPARPRTGGRIGGPAMGRLEERLAEGRVEGHRTPGRLEIAGRLEPAARVDPAARPGAVWSVEEWGLGYPPPAP